MVGVVIFDGDLDLVEVGFTTSIEAFEDLGHGIDTDENGKAKNNENGDDNEKLGKSETAVLVVGWEAKH